ncbi:MAG: hypothetical protein KF774_10240 [Planctomyces sp.]|nr:hypothetical protein [Planctomyces sp.]
MSIDAKSESKPYSPGRFVMFIILLVTGTLLARQRLENQRNAAREKQNNPPPVLREPDDPLARWDFQDGPVLEMVPDPTPFADELFAKAQASTGEAISSLYAAVPNVAKAGVVIGDTNRTLRSVQEDYREYRLRERAAYERLTQDPPEARLAGLAFLTKYLAFAAGTDDAPSGRELLDLADVAQAAGSTDPLLRAYIARIRYQFQNRDPVGLEAALGEALPALLDSEYPRIALVNVRSWLHQHALNSNGKSSRWPALAIAIAAWLHQDSSDPALRSALHEHLRELWNRAVPTDRGLLIALLLQREGIDPWLLSLYAGLYEADLDSDRRHRGNTGNKAWEEFTVNERAVQLLMRAWLLDPTLPQPATSMIQLAATQQRDTRAARRILQSMQSNPKPGDWFQAAINAQFDEVRAYESYASLLESAGLAEDTQRLARALVETGRFDTQLPALAVDLLRRRKTLLDKDDARTTAERFLELRELFRMRNPEASLPSDGPLQRAQLALLLELVGLTSEAVAEAQLAGLDAPWEEAGTFSDSRRLLRLKLALAADIGPDRIADFSRRVNMSLGGAPGVDLDQLQQDAEELESLTRPDNVWGRRYLTNVLATIRFQQALNEGKWIDLPLSEPFDGWEILVAQRPPLHGPSSWMVRECTLGQGRLLGSFSPPLEIEARPRVLNADDGPFQAGFRWEQPVAHSGLTGRHILSWKLAPTRRSKERQEPAHTLCELSVSKGQQTHGWSKSLEQQPQSMTIRLWPAFVEVAADTVWFEAEHLVTGAPGEFLAVDQFLRSPPAPGEAAANWEAPFESIRIRRMSLAPPPSAREPLDIREAYWERRLQADRRDGIARLKLAEVRLKQHRVEDALALLDEADADPGPMVGSNGLRGKAAYLQRRYQDALDLLQKADADGTDPMIYAIQGEIHAAAPGIERNLEFAEWHCRMANCPEGKGASAVVHAAKGDFARARELNREAVAATDGAQRAEYVRRQALYDADQAFQLPE